MIIKDLGRVTGLSAFEIWQSVAGNEDKTIEDFFAYLTPIFSIDSEGNLVTEVHE